MSDMTAAESIPQTIDTDVTCIHCSYNLRTLAADSRCPECGHDVQPSIDAHRHAAWAKRINPGLKWIIIAACVYILGSLCNLLSLLTFVALTSEGPAFLSNILDSSIMSELLYIGWHVIARYAHIISAVLMLIGAFLVTRTTMASPIRRDTEGLRKIMRYYVIGYLLFLLFSQTIWLLLNDLGMAGTIAHTVLFALAPAGAGVIFLIYLSRISAVCDHHFAARRTTAYLGLGISATLGTAHVIISTLLYRPPRVMWGLDVLVTIITAENLTAIGVTIILISICRSLRKKIQERTQNPV